MLRNNSCFLYFVSVVRARIERGPRNVGENVGSSVQLKCLFHHRSCSNVLWSRIALSGSAEILYSGGIMLESHGNRYGVNTTRGACALTVNNLHFSDAGTFVCIDAVPGPIQLKRAATVTVIGKLIALSNVVYSTKAVFAYVGNGETPAVNSSESSHSLLLPTQVITVLFPDRFILLRELERRGVSVS